MMKRQVVAVALALLVGLPLVACASDAAPGGPSSATATATATPEPSATVAEPGPATVIVLTGDRLLIQDAAGATIDEHPFSDDPAEVVESLASAIGAEPEVVEYDTAGDCTAVGTAAYSWVVGDVGLSIRTASPDAVAPWDTLDLRTGARSIGDILIVTSAGFSVGDDTSAFVQTLPADERNDSRAFIWDRVGTYDSQPFGGTAITDEAGVVDFIGTPGLMQSWYC